MKKYTILVNEETDERSDFVFKQVIDAEDLDISDLAIFLNQQSRLNVPYQTNEANIVRECKKSSPF